MAGGQDRIELMESLGITVMDGTGGDNLYLGRNNIYVPYNITNFMLYDESILVTDVLRRFRERQLVDNPSAQRMDDWWAEARRTDKNSAIALPESTSKEVWVDTITQNKQKIRKKLKDKGLLCSESE